MASGFYNGVVMMTLPLQSSLVYRGDVDTIIMEYRLDDDLT